MLRLPLTCLGIQTLMRHSELRALTSQNGSRYVVYVRPPLSSCSCTAAVQPGLALLPDWVRTLKTPVRCALTGVNDIIPSLF